MSSAVVRNCDNVASSHSSAGTASMASAIAAGFGAERINCAAAAIGFGQLLLGLLLVILAALPDLFDGALAKASNSSSQRGAYFDSVVDRVTDAMLFGGVAWYLASNDSPHMSILPFAVMALS